MDKTWQELIFITQNCLAVLFLILGVICPRLMKTNFYIYYTLQRLAGIVEDQWLKQNYAKYYTFIFVVDARNNFLWAILVEILALLFSLFTVSKVSVSRRLIFFLANVT